MKKFVKICMFIIIIIFTVLMQSCSKGYLQADEKKKNIDVIVKMKDAEFWKTVKAGAEVASKEFGVNIGFDAPNDEKDIEGQIAMVNRAIERKSDALVLAASDYEKLVAVAEKAISAKIPVIIIDSALNSNRMSSFIATDNRDAGKKVGNKLLEVSGDECNVAIMSFVKGAATADQREEGLMEVIKKYPGIKIVSKEYCFSDTKLSNILTKKILLEHPEVNAFVGLNAMSTEGVAHAFQDLKMNGKIKIIGFDSTPEEIDFIEDNIIQATVVQRPFNMGYLGIKYAVWAIDGKSVPPRVDTGSVVIDKTNLYTPENQKLLFPFVK